MRLSLIRDANCDLCRMHTGAEGADRCVVARSPAVRTPHPIMVVAKNPGGSRQREEMSAYLRDAGIDPETVVFASAIKCRTFDIDPNKKDLKACREYLDAEIETVKPKFILALGNEPLTSLTSHSGIMKYRGQTFEHKLGPKVFATISPASVARNPGQRSGFVADLRYFANLVIGKPNDTYGPPADDRWFTVFDKSSLKKMVEHIGRCDTFSVDIETTGPTETAVDGRIVSIAVTCRSGDDNDSRFAYAVPLYHPQSPFRTAWVSVLTIIGKAIAKAQRRVIAQNGKFDLRWVRHFSPVWKQIVLTFDTILAQHILDENQPKGLKPNAQRLLGVPPWGIDTRDLLNEPIEKILEYNMLDTWYTLDVSDVLKQQLIKQPRKARVFKKLLMPLSETLTNAEAKGVWLDEQLAHTNRGIAIEQTKWLTQKLMRDVPPRDVWPDKIKEVNFNASNFARWWLFDYLGFPVMARGKQKDDGSPGDPSMGEASLMAIAASDHPHASIAQTMLERSEWNRKTTAFFDPYLEQVDERGYIHTNFKIFGTVTGRLSSGKADQEKVTAKKQYRGVNLQQVPRDTLIRGVFGAPPGRSFVQADYSQIELRIVAFIARERNMLHHYATGQDLHMAMAMRMTGKPKSKITKEERKRAKPVNFGFAYGMGTNKFIIQSFIDYGIRFSMDEAQSARRAYFDMWPDLIPWHNKQRRLAHKFGRVESPFGRVRHLPDVYSPDQGVRAEAERQAINSPVQAFASDMAVLSMILIDQRFRDEDIDGHIIGTVHDAINFDIADHDLARALPIIKDIMENLPLRRMFGIHLDVPIVADLSVGTHWGGARELTAEEVYDWKAA